MPHSPDYLAGYQAAMNTMSMRLQAVEQDRVQWVRQYGKTKGDLDILQTSYDSLQADKDSLQAEYDAYKVAHP